MNATTTNATTTRADAPASGLFINRSFALLWGGQAVSNLGDWVFSTTLVLWIAAGLAHDQAWAPLAVSGVLIARFAPTLAIGPFAGVFVDRWDKRRILLWADALRALLIALLLPVAAFATAPMAWRLGAIYGIVVLTTVCAQFFDPARLALIGDLVAEPYRPRASSLEQITLAVALVVGPVLAAPLYFGLGVRWAIIANALSFAVSFLAILRLRAPHAGKAVAPQDRAQPLREFIEGLRFYAGNRVLMVIAVAAVLAMLGFGALNALDIFFVTGNLHASARLYGLLGGASGVGLLAGAILGGLIAGRVGLGRLLWLSLLAMGLLVLVYARLTGFTPALGVLFLLGMANGVVNVVADPLLLRVTPRALVGRVTAVLMPLMSLASVASIAAAGLLDGTVLRGFHAQVLGVACGPVDTIFSAAGLLAVAGALYAMVNLRDEPKATDERNDGEEDAA